MKVNNIKYTMISNKTICEHQLKKNDEIQQEFGIQTDKYEKYETNVDLTDDE